MTSRHSYVHHHKHYRENLDVCINNKLVLTIRNIQKMAIININVDDNQAELDALKQQAADALASITDGITKAQAVAEALQAFQISFTASVAPAQ